MMYDPHIISILTQFYLDPKFMTVYHGRWDTWMAINCKWDEYFYMMLKTDDQVTRLLAQARESANIVTTSPLAKAMTESSDEKA